MKPGESSDAQRSLLEKLAEEASDEGSMEVVLSPEEMACFRQLSGIEFAEPEAEPEPQPATPAPRLSKRTAELQVTPAELEFLRQFGAEAHAATSPPPSDVASRRRLRKRTTDITFTPAEIEFLRKLSGRELPEPPSGPLPVKEKLRTGDLPADGDVVLPVTHPEAHWLNDITREGYSFITAEEQRARLELRQKIHEAIRVQSGRLPEAPDRDR